MPSTVNQHETPPIETKVDSALSATQFEALSAQIEENKRLLHMLLAKFGEPEDKGTPKARAKVPAKAELCQD